MNLEAALGPLSAHSEDYCTVSCLKRQKPVIVAKLRKMLEERLKWREAYMPEEDIRKLHFFCLGIYSSSCFDL
jgi:hypothetical protein